MEELQRTKPAQAAASAAASGSFLGLGGSTAAGGNGIGGAGALDVLTRKFKHTMVELINTDLSQPIINGPSSHSPMQAASRQQPQQPVQQPQQRSAPAVSSQQQQQQRPEPLQRQQQPQADASTASSEQGAPSGASQVASSDSLQPGERKCLPQCRRQLHQPLLCVVLVIRESNFDRPLTGPCLHAVQVPMQHSSSNVCQLLTP